MVINVRRIAIIWAGMLVLLPALAACGDNPPTATVAPQPTFTTLAPTPANAATPQSGATPMPNVATVESVVVNTQSTTPNEVEVTIKGYLPNPCTKVVRIEQQRNADTFTITLETVREGSNCIEVISPFEETVALDTNGLAPGTYTVSVQNTTITFDLN
jgi:hypothetical protein